MTEFELFRVRIALLQAYLQDKNYDGILLSRVDNFAMATGGKRNYIWKYTDHGANSLFVDKSGKVYYVGNNIEESRILEEELSPFGCEKISFLWFESTPADSVRRYFSDGLRLVSDDGSLGPNVNEDLSVLRALMTELEMEKYRRLGRLASEAMVSTLKEIKKGTSEADIASRLVYEGHQRGCLVPVALVASDERIAKYRHPLPVEGSLMEPEKGKRVERYVMVVGCFLKEGLVVSLTRFKKVDSVPEEIEDAYRRICGVDTLIYEATKPNSTLGEVFTQIQQAYHSLGFPNNEWHNHHQGGTTGYAGRTCKARPGETFPTLDTYYPKCIKEILGKEILFGSVFAWNPSAKGVKSEDTFILYPDGKKEIVTSTPELPTVDLESVLKRPIAICKSGMATDIS